MKIEKIHEITFETDETIMTATLVNATEIVMMLSSGDVVRYNIENQITNHLFSVKSPFTYSDGGFDINTKTSIYTLDEIVVVANDYKLHGIIHYPNKYNSLRIFREDYHSEISSTPITLYKDDNDIPHIIYSTAWNHIQIMNLDTRQILTAAKSLIEENAEERYIEFSKMYGEGNQLAWPTPYDYFFARLQISPNHKYFLSAGWRWGSNDCYNLYNIHDFINNNRIKDIKIDAWEHENRSVCWINDSAIAVSYNTLTEDDEEADKNMPWQIHFYDFIDNNIKFNRKISIKDLNIVNAEIQFNTELNSIIAYSEDIGVAIISLNGDILYHNNDLKVDSLINSNLFIKTNNKTITISKITNK